MTLFFAGEKAWDSPLKPLRIKSKIEFLIAKNSRLEHWRAGSIKTHFFQ